MYRKNKLMVYILYCQELQKNKEKKLSQLEMQQYIQSKKIF